MKRSEACGLDVDGLDGLGRGGAERVGVGPAGLGTVRRVGSECVEFIVGQILREAGSGPRGGRWGGGTGGSVNPGSARLWVVGYVRTLWLRSAIVAAILG